MSLYSEFIEEKIKIECPICYLHQSDFFTLPDCLHSFCTQCTKCHIETLINDAQVNSIFCPTCLLPIHKYTIAAVVSAETLAKYEKFVMRNNLINNPYAKFCPQPDCEGFDMGGLSRKKLSCNVCQYEYCFFCTEKWHGSRKCIKAIDEDFERWAVGNNVKFCPMCKRRVEKRGGCPNMSCICGHTWCWRCGGSPRDPGHDIRCIIGSDIWNIHRTILFFMIFAPVLLYFIPAVMAIVLLDMMNEGEESVWIIRNRRYFYPLLVVFSPVIEIIGIVCFIVGMSFVVAEKVHRKVSWLVVPGYFFGVALLAGLSVVGCCWGYCVVIHSMPCWHCATYY